MGQDPDEGFSDGEQLTMQREEYRDVLQPPPSVAASAPIGEHTLGVGLEAKANGRASAAGGPQAIGFVAFSDGEYHVKEKGMELVELNEAVDDELFAKRMAGDRKPEDTFSESGEEPAELIMSASGIVTAEAALPYALELQTRVRVGQEDDQTPWLTVGKAASRLVGDMVVFDKRFMLGHDKHGVNSREVQLCITDGNGKAVGSHLTRMASIYRCNVEAQPGADLSGTDEVRVYRGGIRAPDVEEPMGSIQVSMRTAKDPPFDVDLDLGVAGRQGQPLAYIGSMTLYVFRVVPGIGNVLLYRSDCSLEDQTASFSIPTGALCNGDTDGAELLIQVHHPMPRLNGRVGVAGGCITTLGVLESKQNGTMELTKGSPADQDLVLTVNKAALRVQDVAPPPAANPFAVKGTGDVGLRTLGRESALAMPPRRTKVSERMAAYRSMRGEDSSVSWWRSIVIRSEACSMFLGTRLSWLATMNQDRFGTEMRHFGQARMGLLKLNLVLSLGWLFVFVPQIHESPPGADTRLGPALAALFGFTADDVVRRQPWLLYGAYTPTVSGSFHTDACMVLVLIVTTLVSCLWAYGPLWLGATDLPTDVEGRTKGDAAPISLLLGSWDHALTEGTSIMLHKRTLGQQARETIVDNGSGRGERRVDIWHRRRAFTYASLVGIVALTTWVVHVLAANVHHLTGGRKPSFMAGMLIALVGRVAAPVIRSTTLYDPERPPQGSHQLALQVIYGTRLAHVACIFLTIINDEKRQADLIGGCFQSQLGLLLLQLVVWDSIFEVIYTCGNPISKYVCLWILELYKKKPEDWREIFLTCRIDVMELLVGDVVRQGVVWAGAVFCPTMTLAAVVCICFTVGLTTLSIRYFYMPPKVLVSSDKRTQLNGALAATLTITLLPITWFLSQDFSMDGTGQSQCGPHVFARAPVYTSVYHHAGNWLTDSWLSELLTWLLSPLVLLPLVVWTGSLGVTAWWRSRSRVGLVASLENSQRLERNDKLVLLRKAGLIM